MKKFWHVFICYALVVMLSVMNIITSFADAFISYKDEVSSLYVGKRGGFYIPNYGAVGNTWKDDSRFYVGPYEPNISQTADYNGIRRGEGRAGFQGVILKQAGRPLYGFHWRGGNYGDQDFGATRTAVRQSIGSGASVSSGDYDCHNGQSFKRLNFTNDVAKNAYEVTNIGTGEWITVITTGQKYGTMGAAPTRPTWSYSNRKMQFYLDGVKPVKTLRPGKHYTVKVIKDDTKDDDGLNLDNCTLYIETSGGFVKNVNRIDLQTYEFDVKESATSGTLYTAMYDNSYGYSFNKNATAEVIGLTVKDTTLTYNVGQSFDGKGTLVVERDDGTITEYKLTSNYLTDFTTDSVGDKTVTVKRYGLTCTFDIKVKEGPTINSIAVKDTTPAFIVGSDFDDKGTILVEYSDGTTEEVPLLGEYIDTWDTFTLGKKTVHITYKGAVTTYEIEVVENGIKSIVIKNPKEDYKIDEEFKQQGTVVITKQDGTFEEIDLTEDLTSGFDTSKEGEITVTVTVGGISTTYQITVIGDPVITLTGITNEYEKDTPFDGKGEIVITKPDGTVESVPIIEDMLKDFDTSTPGDKTVTVTYNGKEYTFDITVKEPVQSDTKIVSISVKGQKDTYPVDGIFVECGDIIIHYSDGSIRTTPLKYDNISNFDTSVKGRFDVDVSYAGFATSYKITVEPCVTDIPHMYEDVVEFSGQDIRIEFDHVDGVELSDTVKCVTIDDKYIITNPYVKHSDSDASEDVKIATSSNAKKLVQISTSSNTFKLPRVRLASVDKIWFNGDYMHISGEYLDSLNLGMGIHRIRVMYLTELHVNCTHTYVLKVTDYKNPGGDNSSNPDSNNKPSNPGDNKPSNPGRPSYSGGGSEYSRSPAKKFGQKHPDGSWNSTYSKDSSFISGDTSNLFLHWYLNEDGTWYLLASKKEELSTRKYVGWFYSQQADKWYFLQPDTGVMLTGWQFIDGKWYYFTIENGGQTYFGDNNGGWYYDPHGETRPHGSMYCGEKTPDGYTVDKSGAWIN